MANSWFELLSSVFMTAIVLAIVIGAILVGRQVAKSVEDTKTNLRKQGINVSDSGMKIQTDKRYDREDYIDATRQAIVSGMDPMAKASSFRKGGDVSAEPPQPPKRKAARRMA